MLRLSLSASSQPSPYQGEGVRKPSLIRLPRTDKLFELLRSPFTPPQPSPDHGEGVRKPPFIRGVGGVNQPQTKSSHLASAQLHAA